MIKNIVFDFGGVLVGLDKGASVRAFKDFGADVIAKYIDDYRSEDLFNDLELGKITMEDFCDEARRQCDKQLADEDIKNAWLLLLTGVAQKKLDKILSLKKKYRILLLSNTNAFHWEYSVNNYFKDTKTYFEKCYLSFELGLAKPDRRMFEFMIEDSEIVPEETIFIDDSEKNRNAAIALGIHTMSVETNEDWTIRNFDF
ncbi:MAG: HAD family phosphatase [Prevotella sp.]|nr:HAD family phosphatase [Candidatus Equicola stercoris]